MRVNIGQAKTDLSKLLARVEAGEDVEIARAGVPVARFVRIDPLQRPGVRFLDTHGTLANQISIAEDFELSDDDIDEMLDGDA
ncbi:MAG: type II toxin-antitoxin system prevent-host-death family antitoxin [Thermoleophilaceae bacterium]|jgi:prevent-host-death family protein|nr:type II toxin-antitoxin system prevent-host-death family antitoxin [Thermoleophilaceae bacterium]